MLCIKLTKEYHEDIETFIDNAVTVMLIDPIYNEKESGAERNYLKNINTKKTDPSNKLAKPSQMAMMNFFLCCLYCWLY